jgi:curved DNA-binding protein CbpA
MFFQATTQSVSVTTLYDVLGVRPDDDADTFKRAFRQAVKASHPDFHADDPDAPLRFRQVVKAYEILRDPEKRSAYDELLELEREQRRTTRGRYTKRAFAFDALAAAGLAVVLAGGYVLYTDLGAPARSPAEIAAPRSAAAADKAAHDEPRDTLARVDTSDTVAAPSSAASTENTGTSATHHDDASRIVEVVPGLNLPEREILIARIIASFRVAIAHAKVPNDHVKNDSAIAPLDDVQVQSAGVQSSVEGDGGVPSSLSRTGLSKPDEKQGVRLRDTKARERLVPKLPAAQHSTTFNRKASEGEKPVAKRGAAHHAASNKNSLDNRSPSASRDVPHVFGVGF